MNRVLSSGLVLGCLLAPVAGARAQTISVNHEPTADFGRYKTFSWGSGSPARDAKNEARIHAAVEAELLAKGLTKVDKDPDVYVLTMVFTGEKRAAHVSMGGAGIQQEGGWDSGKWAIGKVPGGTLLVDLLDNHDKRMVWRGTAEATLIKNDEKLPERIDGVVKKMFESYPPSASTPALPAAQP